MSPSTRAAASPATSGTARLFGHAPDSKEARRNDPSVIGPFGVDLNRVLNIGKGLSKALEEPKRSAPQTGHAGTSDDPQDWQKRAAS